jgi:FAD/FMN-containing dehydrogenase
LAAAYGARRYERLSALKAEFDPSNMFRFNQNIAPVPIAPVPTE